MSLSLRSNINPDMWGPYYWKVFHLTAFGYPEEPNETDKDTYHNFYINFMKVLPCEKCTKGARKMMENIQWDKISSNRSSLIKWTYDFHNNVNKKLNKISPSFENFSSNLIKETYQECSKKIEYILIYSLLILIILTFIAHYFLEIPLVPSMIVSSFF